MYKRQAIVVFDGDYRDYDFNHVNTTELYSSHQAYNNDGIFLSSGSVVTVMFYSPKKDLSFTLKYADATYDPDSILKACGIATGGVFVCFIFCHCSKVYR